MGVSKLNFELHICFPNIEPNQNSLNEYDVNPNKFGMASIYAVKNHLVCWEIFDQRNCCEITKTKNWKKTEKKNWKTG